MKEMKDEPTEDQSLTPNAHTGLGDFIAWLQKNIPIRCKKGTLLRALPYRKVLCIYRDTLLSLDERQQLEVFRRWLQSLDKIEP